MTGVARSQSINIDLDGFFGGPDTGNGAPSSSFGAAAGQPGVWNRIGFGRVEAELIGLDGAMAGVTMLMEQSGGSGGIGYANESNTGDFALLLNDAARVNSVVQGGSRHYMFVGLDAATYLLYTYAVRPQGQFVETPIFVPGSNGSQTQIVTGPMPGNAFEYLITHSIHEIDIATGETIEMFCELPPGNPRNSYINGFQLVQVPETNSLITIIIGLGFAASTRAVLRLSFGTPLNLSEAQAPTS